MTLKEIKRAINTVLKKMYPDVKIYGADTMEGYTRPAFFVYVTQTFSEKTKNAVHKNVEIEIDLIQKRPDELAAMELFEKMEAAFGYKLAVGDRKLNTDKCLLLSAIKTYMDEILVNGLIEDYSIEFDVEKIRKYVIENEKIKKEDAEAMSDEEMQKQYTDEKVYFKATVTISDVMEDIYLNITA